MSLAMDTAGQPIRFADFSEHPNPATLPWLDRPDVDEATLTPAQLSWRRDGVLLLKGFLPDAILDPYIARRAALNEPGGWMSPVPYLHVPELKALALYPPMMEAMADLIGEEMLMHLNLTGWISTERNWHQDDYLNPPFVNSWYCAAWMALDTIHPDSGPFEYVPGSHRWPLMRGEMVRRFLTPEERDQRDAMGINWWAKFSERYVVPAIEAEVAGAGVAPVQFLAEKGDVLLWHGRLMHRGTAPRVPGMPRRSLIAHYSGIEHREDMTVRERDANGQPYAWFDFPLG